MKQESLRVKSRLPSPCLKQIRVSAISFCSTALGAVDEEELFRLTESVRRHGLIQPIGVRRKPGFPARYELLFGYRRLLACRALYLPKVPCLIFPDRRESALIALCENFQRRKPREEELFRASSRLGVATSKLCASLPFPCPETKKDAPSRDISLFLEEETAAPSPAASLPLRRGVVRDPRLVANSIERVVCAGREAGVRIELQKVRGEREISFHIRLPLSDNVTVFSATSSAERAA